MARMVKNFGDAGGMVTGDPQTHASPPPVFSCQFLGQTVYTSVIVHIPQ